MSLPVGSDDGFGAYNSAVQFAEQRERLMRTSLPDAGSLGDWLHGVVEKHGCEDVMRLIFRHCPSERLTSLLQELYPREPERDEIIQGGAFERLKHDFKYNLSLLRERDIELEKYDLEIAALRGDLERHISNGKTMQVEASSKEKRIDDERRKVAALRADVAEGEKKALQLEAQLASASSDASRLQGELDETIKERAEALASVTKSQAEVAERAQEVASVRSELQLRLQQEQHKLSEVEESWRATFSEERSQNASRAKQARTEATREASALQEQLDKLLAEAAESSRSHDAAMDELRTLKEAQGNDSMRARYHQSSRVRSRRMLCYAAALWLA